MVVTLDALWNNSVLFRRSHLIERRQPHEKDMTIIHAEVVAKLEDHYLKTTSSMKLEGIPYGDSAMARCVSLPAAIAAKGII